MSTARRLHHSYADYLRALELSAVKLEYCDGEMYAMAGGTPAHADLAASMTRLLGNALLGRCRVSSSDLKIRIEATDLSTFTDVSVVCGPREVPAIDQNAVTNPALLVETGHFELRAVENRPPSRSWNQRQFKPARRRVTLNYGRLKTARRAKVRNQRRFQPTAR